MRTFGSYEATREIARTAFGQVWRARQIGAQDERFVVKTIDCGELSLVADDAIVSGRLDAFLEAAKVQGAGCSGWATVHQSGRLSDSAYFVTDALPLSVARLVEGRSAINGHVLVSMTTGVCAALLAVRETLQRGHGNLKGANVFFDRDSELHEAKVLLTDPAATSELGADKGEVADLHAIGEMIYQLVVHRPFKALGGWPVPPGKEWDRLGKVGSGWRELCSELLDPDLKPGRITLEQVAQRATGLTPPPRPVLRYVLLAAALIAVIVGGLFAWQNRPWKPLEWDATLWSEVCDNSEWYSMVIEGALAGETDPTLQAFRGKVLVSGDERKDLLATTPDLTQIDPELAGAVRQHVLEFMSKGVNAQAWARFSERYPSVVVEGGVERAVGDLSNDKGRPPWMLGDARRFTAALGSKIMYQTPAFQEFREQSPDGDQDAISKASYGLYFARFMQFELQRVIEAQLQGLRERVGAEGSAAPSPRANEEIRLALERGALWESAEAPTSERLRALASVGRDAARLENGWKTVTASIAQLGASAGSDDSVVRQMLASATEAVGKADVGGGLAAVIETIERWGGTLTGVAALVAERGQKEIDWASLGEREELRAVYEAASAGTLSEEQIAAWIVGIKDEGFWRVPDARPAFAAEAELASAQRVLDSIDSFEQEQNEEDIAAIRSDIVSVRERVAAAEGLKWIRRNREAITSEVAATKADAARAHDAARDLVANIATSAREQIAKWMGEDSSDLTGVAALREKWDATRRGLSVRLDPAITGSPSQLRAALRNARRVLLWDEDARTGERRADGWASRLEAWGAAAPETRPVSWNDGAWSLAIEAQRESMAKALVKSIEGWDATSRLDRWAGFDEVRSVEDRVWEEAEAWAARSRELAADFSRVESLRDRWYGFEEVVADGGPTIRALVDRWERDASMSEAMRCVAVVAADVGRLRTIPAAPRAERASIAGAANEAAWARFAAWRGLGSLGGGEAWPAGAAELVAEVSARSHLLGQAQTQPDVARRQLLIDEIEASGPVRWSTALLRGGPADIEAIMASRESVGVMPGVAGVDPRAAANVALYEFATGVRGQEEAAALSMATSMIASVRALLPTPEAQGELSATLAKLERTIGGDVDRKSLGDILKENGPGKHPDFRIQSMQAGEDEFAAPLSITYVSKGSHVLEFIRVDDSELEPVYVCTEELSVAEAGALLAIFPGGVRRAGRTWYQLEAENDPEGVITWEVKGTRIAPFSASPNGWWSVDNVGAAEAFPAGMTPPGPPVPETPIQWIEPVTIEALAATVGCRLPTSAEWKMALARERRESAARGQALGGNFRDATFAAFTAHVAELRQRSTVRSLEYPHRESYDPGDLRGGAIAEPAVSENDGSLWFETPAHPGRGVAFKHLLGNVAEFVSDTPGAKSGYGIVGGSAMSASRDVESVTPAKSESSFADVGGRLAFSLKDLKPPMWAALFKDLGDPLPYIFVGRVGE